MPSEMAAKKQAYFSLFSSSSCSFFIDYFLIFSTILYVKFLSFLNELIGCFKKAMNIWSQIGKFLHANKN